MIKLLKNVSASGILINDTGVHIDSGESYTIPPTDYLLWSSSLDYQSVVTSGDIVVNNGSIDLNSNDGIRYIQYADRAKIQLNGTDVTQVSTTLNFTGGVAVTDNGDGKTTVNVTASGTNTPYLREVTTVYYSSMPVNITSNLLFEADLTNDLVHFLIEEII